MPIINAESIVLRNYDLSEADRIVIFYANGYGLIRGVAKGAKRLKSRFGSALEPFSEIRIEYFQKDQNELVSIQKTDLIRSSFGAASDPDLLQTYSYLAEVLLDLIPPNDPDGVLYRMLRACFQARVSSQIDHEALKLYFETWLMRLDGYLPDWSDCSICRRKFTDVETAYLLPSFLLACGDCSGMSAGGSIPPPDRDLLRTIQKVAPEQFLEIASRDLDSVREMRALMGKILATHSGTGKFSASSA